jgi:hypothetical protein
MKIRDIATRRQAWMGIAVLVVLLAALLLPSSACGPRGKVLLEREPAVLLNELNYDLENWLGKKVWVLGFYGDERISGDGIAFLVLDFNSLLIDEALEEHTFARLVGDNLPPYDMTGAEIIVYGEVQDYGEVYNDPNSSSVPLIDVERYHVLNEPQEQVQAIDRNNFSAPLIDAIRDYFRVPVVLAREDAPEGTNVSEGDRTLIISGGINAQNNEERYRDNIKAKYKKMRELGLSADQIDVLYADGADVNVTEKVNNVDTAVNTVDAGASKQNVKATIEDYARSMSPSHTLTIFITDHGTGYNPEKGWHGARPAFSGVDATSGKLYAENTIKIDLTKKVFRKSIHWVGGGKIFMMTMNEEGKVIIYMKQDGRWVRKGTDEDGDGLVSESEIGMDIDGDGTVSDNHGWDVDVLEGLLTEDLVHYGNSWDTDKDGTKDVRAKWDGTKYVIERLKPDGTWGKMGEDTNGDNVIDGDDGGVDWNLDGDKDDQVGFYEGINLWGSEVLWDDEFASMLKDLEEKGIHIFAEMVSCYSGGFIANLEGIVEGIYTGSSEDTPHVNRMGADGKFYAADEMAFLQNLNGFGWTNWIHASKMAIEADTAAAGAHGEKNFHMTSFPTFFDSDSAFQSDGSGVYTTMIDLPNDLDEVYDFEIIFGLQEPPWLWAGFPEGLPAGMQDEMIAGGIRVWSSDPLPVGPFLIKIKGDPGSEVLNIRLTDKEHHRVGYLAVTEGEIPAWLLEGSPAPPATLEEPVLTLDWKLINPGLCEVYADLVWLPLSDWVLTLDGPGMWNYCQGQRIESATQSGTLGDDGRTRAIWQINIGGSFSVFGTVDSHAISSNHLVVTGLAPPCFACDTLVLMADNSLKCISDVQVGDMIQAYDFDTGRTLIADVTATNNGEADHYYLINGNLKVTPPHPFFTAEGQWVKITSLKAGDKIRSFQGLVEITSIEKVNSGQRICNISVGDFHNFFVSANGKDFYLVHEGSPCKD